MQHLLFCDEYGNTGANLFDREQPFFAYGFLGLTHTSLISLELDIRNLYISEGLELREMKSSQLWTSATGLRRYAKIGEILGRLNDTICVISLVEKRYQACTLIVEIFLDPLIHAKAPRELLAPKHRQAFADAAYNALPDDSLLQLSRAVAKDDADEIAQIGDSISRTLQLHPSDFVSYSARQMETRPEHVFRYGKIHPDITKPGTAPQYAAFFPGIARLDLLLAARRSRGTLVRGEDSVFGSDLQQAFELATMLETIPNGRAYGASRNIGCIVACREGSPKELLGVQLADLLAGIVGRVVISNMLNRSLTNAQQRATAAWRTVLKAVAPNHYWMLSNKHLDSVGELFGF